MTVEANKELIRRRAAYANEHDVEGMLSMVSSTYRDHSAPPPGLPGGREGDRQFFTMLFSAFPDLAVSLDDLIGEADRVVERITLRGTHQGVFMGAPPTGIHATWSFINIYRFSDGQVTEIWSEGDHLGLMRQIGLVPPPPAR